jgi:hypothetical protein
MQAHAAKSFPANRDEPASEPRPFGLGNVPSYRWRHRREILQL